MTGFCGWVGIADDAPKAHLEAMLPGASAQIIVRDCALAVGDGVDVARDGQWLAVVTGRPRFLDPELARRAAEAGPAAAILSVYRAGIGDAPAKVHGRFALAIIDTTERTVLLAIDRFGVERLCYAPVRDGVVFASSADWLIRHPAMAPQLSPQGLFHYVYFHCLPSPNSIYRHVHKLKLGEQVYFAKGRTSSRQYAPVRFTEARDGDELALARELRERLEQAVRQDASGDRTVGAFLSGGLDSSTVAGLLAKVRPEERARTFTMGFSAEGYDESEFARIVARKFNTDHHEYYVTPDDVLAMVPRVAAHYDEPFGNSSAVAAYYCAKLAKDSGVEVMLAGDGGDELFAGNSRYAKQALFEFYGRVPGAVRDYLIEAPLSLLPARKIPGLSKLASYVEQAKIPLPDRLQTYNFLHRHALDGMFTADFLATIDSQRPLKQLRESYWGCEAHSSLDRMLHLDWKFTLADNDLVKVTGMCDLAGVEVRYPMLDDEVVALSTRIPAAMKLPGQKLRHFYKQAFSGFLPDATINKSKHGFGLPFGVWLRTEPKLQALAYDSLSGLRKRGFLRPEFIDEAMAQHRDGHAAYYGELVWILMMLELWLQSRSVSL